MANTRDVTMADTIAHRTASCTECAWRHGGEAPDVAARQHCAHFGHDVMVTSFTVQWVSLVERPYRDAS